MANDIVYFRQIDDTNRADHYHVTAADLCYFLFEYTSGKDYRWSQTNQLISNLKKKPSLSQRTDYRYKGIAIRECSQRLAAAINVNWLNGATLVPIPPSKAVGHPDYDDRVLQICRGIPAQFPIDVRELVTQRKSIEAAHEGHRPSVEELIDLYQINAALTAPTPQRMAILDDVLTAGVHWRAMHQVLSERFPDVPIVGMFIARRIFPPDHLAAGFEPVFSD